MGYLTYFIDFAKNLTKTSNIGVVIYLILNVFLVITLFSNGFTSPVGIVIGIGAYLLSLIIALSPIGEWVLRWQTGCKKLKRKEHINRLEPLFLEVLAKAKKLNPSIPDDVRLFICDDKEPNAFATGRKTVCLTKGFLNYSDEEIKAVFAHELGHLAHKDTDFILLVTIGNFIVTAFFAIFRGIVNLFGFIFASATNNAALAISRFLTDFILGSLMWMWTKIGTLLVMHSSRKNEYLADEFAFNLGYGDSLAAALDTLDGGSSKGLWANLVSSHPDTDVRIAKLQELGSRYIKEA